MDRAQNLVRRGLLVSSFSQLTLQLLDRGFAVVMCATMRDFGRHGPTPIPCMLRQDRIDDAEPNAILR